MPLENWFNVYYPKIKIVLQAFYWLVSFIALGLLYNLNDSFENGEAQWFTKEYLLWAVISFPFKLALFYSYFYYFIPKWLDRKTGLFFLVSILFLVTYPPLKLTLDNWVGVVSFDTIMVNEEQGETWQYWTEMIRRSITVVDNILVAFFLRFSVDWFKNIRLRGEMQKQQIQSELAMLRNQVNPHFLFNTLNNIDAMIYKVAPEGSLAINKLATIMRYMLYESNAEYVPLEKEIQYIHNYFELQKLRLKNKEVVNLEVVGEVEGVKVAPLLFIPFVENAFKHGTFGTNGPSIFCKLEVKEQEVTFYIENSHEPSSVESKDETGGIGLENIRRRLALIYPGKHTFEVVQGPPKFKVQLTLQSYEA